MTDATESRKASAPKDKDDAAAERRARAKAPKSKQGQDAKEALEAAEETQKPCS